MTESLIFKIALGAGAAAFLALAVWFFRLRPERLERYEPLPRNRTAGGILGILALIWCVPYARVVVFDWMVPLLWPLVIVFSILGILYLDYLFSRALAGVFILSAYYFINSSFIYDLPGSRFLAVGMWLLAILGIAFSCKPCWMRDLIRSSCAKPKVRYAYGIYFALLGLSCLFSLIAGLVHGF